MYELVEKTPLSKIEIIQLQRLWNAHYPQVLHKNTTQFMGYLNSLTHPRHFLITNVKKEIVAWMFCFTRNNEIWFGIMCYSQLQKKGIGSLLIHHAQKKYNALHGWVVINSDLMLPNGKPYISPLKFYKKLGFSVTQESWKTEVLKSIQIRWQKTD